MDQKLGCDFYITKWKVDPFKQMDYNELHGFKRTFNNIQLYKKNYWQKGMLNLVFKNYKNYILIGDPHSISTWVMLILTKILGKNTYLWTHGWDGDETKNKKKNQKLVLLSFFKCSTLW